MYQISINSRFSTCKRRKKQELLDDLLSSTQCNHDLVTILIFSGKLQFSDYFAEDHFLVNENITFT